MRLPAAQAKDNRPAISAERDSAAQSPSVR